MKIKLLQWNIWYREKIENVVKLIKEIEPDIVGLQELGVNSSYNTISHTANYVRDELGFYSYFEIAQQLHNTDAIGNGIFSRFPLRKTTAKYVQKPTGKPNDYAHEGRIYIEAELQVNDASLTIGTTHLSYTHKFQITEDKKREVDNLVNIIKEKKNNYIFTGDLNSTPDSYSITEISKYLINCSPDFSQNSWTTKPFDYNGFKEDKLNWRLDYVFGTKDINVISSEIVKTEYSDHLPILITIQT